MSPRKPARAKKAVPAPAPRRDAPGQGEASRSATPAKRALPPRHERQGGAEQGLGERMEPGGENEARALTPDEDDEE